ncbi:glyoxalase/bleomycin resistance protein/dioxygenase [Natrialba hulunbeirensis JCM 10989]|uniref:Glyoxalase/bleomycin resistance protein/dioxygenase n=1 Tax=Natrialba hulunbeirensis JCM 10989 TaxID=1227493 RepID=L9ZPB9_9EURY|nr:VOC family protein [Natrialba hulunbeirensis]ELY88204.1 glyoxalase/bleomycin resistance protein/dioxygenase [Natrialba hulunbeirensis JCM 10989]
MHAVDHINIDVDDLTPCYEFYRDELGLEVRRPPSDFKGDHAMFQVGDTVVTLAETGRADGWDERGLDHPLDKAHIAFETNREEYERIMGELGTQFPKQGPYDWDEFEGFYFLDPDGNLLEVITDESPAGERERPLLTHDSIN